MPSFARTKHWKGPVNSLRDWHAQRQRTLGGRARAGAMLIVVKTASLLLFWETVELIGDDDNDRRTCAWLRCEHAGPRSLHFGRRRAPPPRRSPTRVRLLSLLVALELIKEQEGLNERPLHKQALKRSGVVTCKGSLTT